MTYATGCGVRRQLPTPVPAATRAKERWIDSDMARREDRERAMKDLMGLYTYDPEVGWHSIYLRAGQFYAYIDQKRRYTRDPAATEERLLDTMLDGPYAVDPPWEVPTPRKIRDNSEYAERLESLRGWRTAAELARILEVDAKVIRQWRTRGCPYDVVRMQGSVEHRRYHLASIRRWLEGEAQEECAA